MNPDLKSRIPVAIIYVLSIVILLWLGGPYDMVLLVVLYLASLYEFNRVSGLNDKTWKSIIPGFAPGLLLMILAVISPFKSIFWLILLAVSVIYFVANFAYLMTRGKILFRSNYAWLDSIMYLSIPFSLVVWKTNEAHNFHLFLLSVFVLIWLNDTGAYFVGSTFGKTKLHKTISPNKTWEGLIGGITVGLLAAWTIFRITDILSLNAWIILALSIISVSVVGDLSESAWKRSYGIKDTSSILKGHGGFLDRLDSFIYSAPFAVLAYEILNIIY